MMHDAEDGLPERQEGDGEGENHNFVMLRPSITASLPVTSDFAHWSPVVPIVVTREGDHASRRFAEFFTANIRNPNTRAAYFHAASRFFAWCEGHGISLRRVEPMLVAAYIEQLQARFTPPSVKQHLAALRMLFDWLVVGQVVPFNPAASVRGPRYVMKRGKTPVLAPEDARNLLEAIPTDALIGLRDRALIGTMVYTFARVGAAVALSAGDYFPQGKRWWLRLHEKGGKLHEVPVHHKLEEYLDTYLDALGRDLPDKAPLFRTAHGKSGRLTDRRLTRNDALRMVRRRAKAANLHDADVCCHTFRATGITAFLENGGSLENAQAIAAHESPRTTKLYDRTADAITLEEIERVRL